MSGGSFNYNQYHIQTIINSIESVIEYNGKPIPDPSPWDNEYYSNYPPEIIDKFQEGLTVLKKAYVYAQRIDWLLSGDDGEENFLKRLEKDLNALK